MPQKLQVVGSWDVVQLCDHLPGLPAALARGASLVECCNTTVGVPLHQGTMPLKKRIAETEGDGSATEPLISANPAGGAQRTVSIALPTPFRDAAGTGHPDGLVPLKRAGGIFKDKYGEEGHCGAQTHTQCVMQPRDPLFCQLAGL